MIELSRRRLMQTAAATIFNSSSPLLDSGLLGPVVIETAKTILTSGSTSAAAPSTPLPQPEPQQKDD